MKNMLDFIRNQIFQYCPISLDKPILVGVSGGPDSVCLLAVLHELGYSISIGHFNHQLRPQADEEAHGIEDLSQYLDIPFYYGTEDVGAYALKHSSSVEEAARDLRYRFLFDKAKELGAQAVAVGHTADDQVETLLIHLIRGSGMDGLGGMHFLTLPNEWSREIPLIRPLLGVWREQVNQYLVDNKMHTYDDLTNLETKYLRNRIRHELIPNLQSYNPQIKNVIYQTADILRNDEKLINILVEKEWQACYLEGSSEYICINNLKFAPLPIAMKRRIIRKAINELHPGIKNLDFVTVARLINCIESHSRHLHTHNVIADIHFQIEGDQSYFYIHEPEFINPRYPRMSCGERIYLEAPGQIRINDQWMISSKILNPAMMDLDPIQNHRNSLNILLDFDLLKFPLQLRTRLPGDRFQPLGMPNHSMKISDFMINKKIPRKARENWPLLCSENHIIWVVGYHIAHPFRITKKTKTILSVIFQQYAV